MPSFAGWFQQRVTEALALAHAGDMAAASPLGSHVRREWHVARVELLYEFAYLRMYIEWELFLEQTLLRYLCGYVSVHGTCTPISGVPFTTLSAAETAMNQGRAYILWHNPDAVIGRARRFLVQSPHEIVINSYVSRLGNLASVRHRIAHNQEDAKRNFDIATTNIAGRRYRGARPGRFLRDWDRSVAPHRRWLEALGTDLVNLAQQIA